MHTYIHASRFYFYILAILGVYLYLLFMLLLETVSFVSAGVVFVLAYSGILKAQPSICQIAGSPNLLRSDGELYYQWVGLISR